MFFDEPPVGVNNGISIGNMAYSVSAWTSPGTGWADTRGDSAKPLKRVLIESGGR